MKTNTRQLIYSYISKNFPITVKNIVDKFELSPQIIHRHIKKLIIEEKISKRGIPPKVYYFPTKDNIDREAKFSDEESEILDENFILFNADGAKYTGVQAFEQRCKTRKLDPYKEIQTYKENIIQFKKYKNNLGLIDGIEKLNKTFSEVYIDELRYIDFYSISKYGKTKLGNLVLYAKQSGDKELIQDIAKEIKPKITNLIENKHISKFAIIPHSIKRHIQFLPELQKYLDINLPLFNIIKIFADKIVAQKSLSKTQERIINARETIFLTANQEAADTVLLVDDAVGSGSTLNETAKKLKDKKLAKKVIGLAIVGSFKGFEVIKEA